MLKLKYLCHNLKKAMLETFKPSWLPYLHNSNNLYRVEVILSDKGNELEDLTQICLSIVFGINERNVLVGYIAKYTNILACSVQRIELFSPSPFLYIIL